MTRKRLKKKPENTIVILPFKGTNQHRTAVWGILTMIHNQHRHPEQQYGVIDGVGDPHPEDLDVEEFGILRLLVQLRESNHRFGAAVSVEQSEH